MQLIFGILIYAVGFVIGLFMMDLARPLSRVKNLDQLDDWADMATGSSGWIDIERAWLRKAQELYRTFTTKQHDYGPDNIAVGGLKGIAMRMGDKVSRIWELTGLSAIRKNTEPKGDAAVANEPVRDAFADLADYGIMAMIVNDGEWPLKTADQSWGIPAAYDILETMLNNATPEELNDFAAYVEAKVLAADIGAKVEAR